MPELAPVERVKVEAHDVGTCPDPLAPHTRAAHLYSLFFAVLLATRPTPT